jgi:membrane fusion protein (multidrug efflux system)
MRLPNITRLLAAGLFLALGGCGGGQSKPAPAPPEVGVLTLHPETADLTIELPGRVSAFETSEVRPQVSGIIRRRYFTEGAHVDKGELLYQIDDAPYRAALGTAQGQLARARAAIESTRLQSERYAALAELNAVSRQDADNARSAAGQAQADVVAAEGAERSAGINLAYTQVRAPISGRIGRSLFTVGALVQSGQADPLATIQRLDPVHVDISQSAAELLSLRMAMAGGRVSGGGPSSVRVDLVLPNGAPYPVPGTLQFADVTVDASTGSVTLRARVPNPDELLLPGMFVRARILEGVAQRAILAPASAVTRDEAGRPTALVLDRQNRVVQRAIQTSRLLGSRWLVTAGLAAGDRLVVQGMEKAVPGTIVKPHLMTAMPTIPTTAAVAPSAPAG